MDTRLLRSWTLIFHAASNMRDQAFSMGNTDLEKLTVAQERVLQAVFRQSPQGVMLKDIAKQVHLTPGAVSQIIDVLVKHDMVERTSDPHDRRAVNIHISKHGAEQRQRMVEHFDREMEKILGASSPEERDAFVTIMGKIASNFSNSQVSARRYLGETLLSMEEYK